MVTATAAAQTCAPAAKRAAPEPFRKRETQISSFSFERRVAALSFAAQVFGVEPGDRIPSVEVHYEVPASGPVAERLCNEENPQEAFKARGDAAWNYGGTIHFNAWKMSPSEVRRASALAHEMAHIIFALQAGMNGQVVHDSLAYYSAAEGVATYAEIARLRASGMGWKGFPPGMPEEYHLGFAFFNSLREAAGGAKAAFHLLASNLPRDMHEIVDPRLYLARVASERAAAEPAA